MPILKLVTEIAAPIEVVFDLARSIDAHQSSQSSHMERAVGGRTSGLIELGEEVTWEAVHFGIRQRLTSRIVAMNRPHHFRDSMVRGAFRRFDHDHHFEDSGNASTRMTDIFDYSAPLGVLGVLADKLFLEHYMRELLAERNDFLKRAAEK